jgi:hypothetical protein
MSDRARGLWFANSGTAIVLKENYSCVTAGLNLT